MGGVGQVRRQDVQRLHEGEDEAGNDDERDHPEDLAHHARHEHQRHEGGHRGEDREHDRRRDLAGTVDGPLTSVASLFLVAVDVLPDDDRVVDHDAQHDDEGEQGHHVDRHVEGRHQCDGAEEGQGDPEADPEGQSELEEQRQHDEHERESGDTTPRHQTDAVPQHLGLVLPDRQRDAGRHPALRVLHVVPHQLGDLDRALVTRPEDRDHDGGVGVEARGLIRLGEAVDDGGDLRQVEPRAVGTCEQHELFVFASPIGLSDGAEQDLSAVGPHRATRQVQRGPAHGLGHVVEGQPVASKGVLGDLDRDLVGPGAHHLGLRDTGQDRELVADPLGDRLQRHLLGGTGHGDIDDLLPVGQLADDRLLGLGGKRGDGVEPSLDVVNQAAGVGVEIQLDVDHAHALGRRGGDALDPVETLDGLLDPDDDGILDLRRGGPQIGHLDGDHVEGELGEDLLLEVEGGRDPRDGHERHQEIGGDGVACKPLDHPVHGGRFPFSSKISDGH